MVTIDAFFSEQLDFYLKLHPFLENHEVELK